MKATVLLMLVLAVALFPSLCSTAKSSKNKDTEEEDDEATTDGDKPVKETTKPKPAFVAVKRCPSALTFRPQTKPGFKRVESGGFDENDKSFAVCKATIGQKSFIGKGYQFGHKVNGVHVVENCWVVAPNGSEVYVHDTDKISYLHTKIEDNVVIWANIKNFPDFPNITPPPIFSRTSKLTNTTNKQFPARCKHEGEDGHHHIIPGVINENDLSIAVITYGGTVVECTNFDVPVCI